MLLETIASSGRGSSAPRGATETRPRGIAQKLRDEARYDSLAALADAIRRDTDEARAYMASLGAARLGDEAHATTGRQTTRDRI